MNLTLLAVGAALVLTGIAVFRDHGTDALVDGAFAALLLVVFLLLR